MHIYLFTVQIYALYRHILDGLELVAHRGESIASIGIDTWGVDFVCVGKDGNLLRQIYAIFLKKNRILLHDIINQTLPKQPSVTWTLYRESLGNHKILASLDYWINMHKYRPIKLSYYLVHGNSSKFRNIVFCD